MILSSDYLQEARREKHRMYMSRALGIVGICVIAFYFIYQMRDWILLPDISLEQPSDGALLTGPAVLVEGLVTPGARLTVNGLEVYNEQSGRFSATLLFSPGLQTITAVAKNRFGKTQTVERSIVVKE